MLEKILKGGKINLNTIRVNNFVVPTIFQTIFERILHINTHNIIIHHEKISI